MPLRPLAASILLAPLLAAAQTVPPSPAPAPATTPAPEQPEPAAAESTPLSMKSLKLKLSGVLFASWGIDLAGANPEADGEVAGNNRFDVTRAYVNVEPQLTEHISLRITPDITRVSGTGGNVDGNLAFRLKYAYAQFDEIVPGLAVKAGLQQTAYLDFEDSLWKYRVLGSSAYEFFTGKPSSDFGIGVVGAHLDGLLAYQVVLANGEGYTKAERAPAYPNGNGKYKELGARVTVAPFAGDRGPLRGLRLTGFGQYGLSESVRIAGETERAGSLRLLGLASYEHPRFTVAAGYGVTGDDEIQRDDADAAVGLEERRGSLFTGFGFVNLPLHLRLLGRYDAYDPDGDANGDERTRIIGGLAYLFTDQVQVIADWQHDGYAERAARELAPTVVGDRFFLHLEARY